MGKAHGKAIEIPAQGREGFRSGFDKTLQTAAGQRTAGIPGAAFQGQLGRVRPRGANGGFELRRFRTPHQRLAGGQQHIHGAIVLPIQTNAHFQGKIGDHLILLIQEARAFAATAQGLIQPCQLRRQRIDALGGSANFLSKLTV